MGSNARTGLLVVREARLALIRCCHPSSLGLLRPLLYVRAYACMRTHARLHFETKDVIKSASYRVCQPTRISLPLAGVHARELTLVLCPLPISCPQSLPDPCLSLLQSQLLACGLLPGLIARQSAQRTILPQECAVGEHISARTHTHTAFSSALWGCEC